MLQWTMRQRLSWIVSLEVGGGNSLPLVNYRGCDRGLLSHDSLSEFVAGVIGPITCRRRTLLVVAHRLTGIMALDQVGEPYIDSRHTALDQEP